jgi:hypothetical protein
MENQFKQLLEMHQKLIQSLKCEIWRNIDGYDNYAVSNHGRIKNINTGRILKLGKDVNGYLYIDLSKNCARKKFKIHRLVASEFIDNPENKPFVDHIDNDIVNNNVNNLRYATISENCHNAGISKNNTSNIKGVSFDKKAKKWRARITIDGIVISLGYFDDIEDAKQARIKKANEAFGVFVNKCEKLI